MKTTNRALGSLVAVSGSILLAGCNLTGAMDAPPSMPTGSPVVKSDYKSASIAGRAVPVDADAAKLTKLVAQRNAAGAFGMVRSDPFALTSLEKSFETTQETERFFSGVSGFSVQLTPKPQVEDEVTPPEAQPYRRLSGIVVGDSILAIYEEEGREPIIVTPGMKIPNSEWRVVSIDQDKAVLRRSGRIKPTQVIVRLETPRDGFQTGGNAGGSPGGPPAGYNGGPPPGYGGGPGGRPGGTPAGRGGFGSD